MRCLVVIDMVIEETRLFTTKTKTNFAITFQLVKPEEYLMRKTMFLEDKFEKKIKAKCHRIMALEHKGVARKKEQKKQDSIKAKFRGNLIKQRDNNRISHFPKQLNNSDDSVSYNKRKAQSLIIEDNAEDDDETDLGDPMNQPLLKTQFEVRSEDEAAQLGLVLGEKDDDINKMNVGEIMRYTAKRKMSYDENIFKSVNRDQFQNFLNPENKLDHSNSDSFK